MNLEPEAVRTLTDQLFPLLIIWAFMSARFIGIALVFPWFSWLNLPMTIRFAFAGAMGLPFAYIIASTQFDQVLEIPAATLALLAAKELTIGFALGLLAGLPFWAAQSAGELIDTYRGSSAGTLFDPSLTTETSELGATFMLIALALLTWSGGFAELIGTIYATFAIWPPLEFAPVLAPDMAHAGGWAISKVLVGALGIAGALLICLFAIDLALALTGRSTRQFQVFELSLNVKNTAFAILLPLLALPLLNLIATETDSIGSLVELVRAIVK